MPVTKQFVGDFVTSTGFQVHLRDMGTYNATLLGQVLSDFFPLSSDDVLLVRHLLLVHHLLHPRPALNHFYPLHLEIGTAWHKLVMYRLCLGDP